MSKPTIFTSAPQAIEVEFSEGGWTQECNHTYYETTAWNVTLEGVDDFDMNIFYMEYEDGGWDISAGLNYMPDKASQFWEDYALAQVDSYEYLTVRQAMMLLNARLRDNLIGQLAEHPITMGWNFLKMLNAWDAYLLTEWHDGWLGESDGHLPC